MPGAHYAGPPVGEPAAPDWHPPQQDPTPAPRPLPAIDQATLDLEERKATQVTYAIGIGALGLLTLVLCARLL